MATLLDPAGHSLIVPNFSKADRVKYVQDQLVDIRDMLDGAEDCKWIYNALFEYTLGLCEMMQQEPTDDEQMDLKDWLAQMRKLDPLRKGRWDDLVADLRF
jgi:geranylgeranyl transferase type-2 subunit alpha